MINGTANSVRRKRKVANLVIFITLQIEGSFLAKVSGMSEKPVGWFLPETKPCITATLMKLPNCVILVQPKSNTFHAGCSEYFTSCHLSILQEQFNFMKHCHKILFQNPNVQVASLGGIKPALSIVPHSISAEGQFRVKKTSFKRTVSKLIFLGQNMLVRPHGMH